MSAAQGPEDGEDTRAPAQWEWELSDDDNDNVNGKTFEEELMEVEENQKVTGKCRKLGKDGKDRENIKRGKGAELELKTGGNKDDRKKSVTEKVKECRKMAVETEEGYKNAV
eukprot:14033050-Ditylum_brightwellii.AAC.1